MHKESEQGLTRELYCNKSYDDRRLLSYKYVEDLHTGCNKSDVMTNEIFIGYEVADAWVAGYEKALDDLNIKYD